MATPKKSTKPSNKKTSKAKAETKKPATKTVAKAKRPAAKAKAKKPATKKVAKPKAKKAPVRPAAPPRQEGERRLWLIKSEPSVYPWTQLLTERRVTWDGVRSFEARNNLRAMRNDDLAFFYHSNEGKEIVGVVRVVGEARPDPTAPDEDWSVVDFSPVRSLTRPVSLATLKATAELSTLELLAKSRLSVTTISTEEFALIVALSATSLEGV